MITRFSLVVGGTILAVVFATVIGWFVSQPTPESIVGKTYGYPDTETPAPASVLPTTTARQEPNTRMAAHNQPRSALVRAENLPTQQVATQTAESVGVAEPPKPRRRAVEEAKPEPTLAEFDKARLSEIPPLDEPEAIPLTAPSRNYVERYRELEAWHDSVASEPADPDWSNAMADHIREYFAGDNLPRGYEAIRAHCRAAICMLQAFAPEYGANRRFRFALQQMRDQPWASSIQRSDCYFHHDDGNTTMLCFLERDPATLNGVG